MPGLYQEKSSTQRKNRFWDYEIKLGIAIVALPTGIITAGYQSAVSKRPDETSEAAEDQEEK